MSRLGRITETEVIYKQIDLQPNNEKESIIHNLCVVEISLEMRI